MNEDAWKIYYEENPPPPGLKNIRQQIDDFCKYHFSTNTSIVLVTSGGTTVPLEHNTVRFVDNFSAGTRGSASAEYFLKAGYAVIFLHRTKSLEPFLRHVSVKEILESLSCSQNPEGCWNVKIDGKICNQLGPLSVEYKETIMSRRLLKIEFTTLSSYLHILYEASQALRHMGKNAIFYLAAAVSDFYIPHQHVATHKIHSDEAFSLNLHLVPKVLQPLVRYWVPEAFVVSFKLETDETILVKKAKLALEKYGHKLVIGNELNSRKYKVIFVTEDEVKDIFLSTEDIDNNKEIEELIVKELLTYYKKFKQC